MDLDLSGKVVVVTGASTGIGRAAALSIASEGGNLAIGARGQAALDETEGVIRDLGSSVIAVAGDLATQAGIDEFISQAIEGFGRIDGLVCCVGSTPLGEFVSLADDEWNRAFEMKLLSTVRVVRTALPHLSRGARIVVTTGSASRAPFAYLTTSTVMNAALEALVASLAGQLQGYGVSVNAVSPGPVDTQRYQGLVKEVARFEGLEEESAIDHITSAIPAGRVGTAEEVGQLIAYLVSPRAEFTNGATFVVDGGQSVRRG